ncbi:MAG: flagellar hook-associated protein FlgK [Paracoccaceae bacterium]
MSISSALANALTGLTANSRMAETVSTNLANALNERFAKRDVVLSSVSLNGRGGGVRVDGVSRAADPAATGLRRAADASLAAGTALADARGALLGAFGRPDDPGGLPARLSGFETAMVAASNNPGSATHLVDAVEAAKRLADTVNRIAAGIQTLRSDSDGEIARQVEALNRSLEEIENLNRDIAVFSLTGRDTGALEDRRAELVDKVARIVPVKTVRRENNSVALFTVNGGTLLNGKASLFAFSANPTITEAMTVQNGALGLVSLAGQPVGSNLPGHFLEGGSLGAHLQIRDAIAPRATELIDGFARDLVGRFEAAGVDPTLPPGAPGLFTDAGAAFDPALETGLAGRLSVNALADPDAGGAVWQLRDGLGAAVPGPVGNNAILLSLTAALAEHAVPASGLPSAGALSAAEFAAAAVSAMASAAHEAENEQIAGAARAGALREAELAVLGVDSDAELQNLIMVEQNYAANARVIAAADGMLQKLLEM